MTALRVIIVAPINAVETAGRVRVGFLWLIVCLHVGTQSILAVTIVVQVTLMHHHTRTVVCGRTVLRGDVNAETSLSPFLFVEVAPLSVLSNL